MNISEKMIEALIIDCRQQRMFDEKPSEAVLKADRKLDDVLKSLLPKELFNEVDDLISESVNLYTWDAYIEGFKTAIAIFTTGRVEVPKKQEGNV